MSINFFPRRRERRAILPRCRRAPFPTYSRSAPVSRIAEGEGRKNGYLTGERGAGLEKFLLLSVTQVTAYVGALPSYRFSDLV